MPAHFEHPSRSEAHIDLSIATHADCLCRGKPPFPNLVGNLRRETPCNAYRLLLEDAKGAIGIGGQIELGITDKRVVPDLDAFDIGEHEVAIVLRLTILAPCDEVVAVAPQETIWPHEIEPCLTSHLVSIVKTDLPRR